MKKVRTIVIIYFLLLATFGSDAKNYEVEEGQYLLGNPAYPAICYSGHRLVPRSVENSPSIEETKEDLRILHAMGIKLIRTYNTSIYPHSERILQSIRELKAEDDAFEMYVMMGVWIQCKNAYEDGTDHNLEDRILNRREIETAIRLADEYADIVKIVAVGNEAMVTWQAHFVPAYTILKYVRELRVAQANEEFPADTLITTSDNWAALGGEEQYRSDDLKALMQEIDYLSLHTYAFHDTYWNLDLIWGPLPEEMKESPEVRIAKAVERSIAEQRKQVTAVEDYLRSIGVEKEIHIGETGWASLDNEKFSAEGTAAAYEYTSKVFYDAVMKWVAEEKMTCCYFEAFDEPWKSEGTAGSEGHFGLITVDGQAKYMLWNQVDQGVFNGLTRGGNRIKKTYAGDLAELMKNLKAPVHYKKNM